MFAQIDWDQLKLIVFDVDGTLYNQKKLRLLMLKELIKHALFTFDFSVFPIIRHYRLYREALGDDEVIGFEPILVKKTSEKTGYPEAKVLSVINEWIETRPLKHLHSVMYEGVDVLFETLRKRGKTVAVLSDYQADRKLAALGLEVDFVVSAQDHAVQILKPHPKGLKFLMAESGCQPDETILIGDRDERDGAAAIRAGTQYLIKTTSNRTERSFSHFNDLLDHFVESCH